MSNETKQTAVEWLYIEMGKFLYGKSEFRDANDILTKAKEMEKEQMIETASAYYHENTKLTPTQYYNETYGSNK
jgi:hypothetical protein